jgi:hypothetical protein
MSKFDLERAKAGDPVRTTCGREARIICFDRLAPNGHHIVALVTGVWDTISTYEEPHKMNALGEGHPYSLEMKPKTVTKWVCYSPNTGWCGVYDTEAKANSIDGLAYVISSFTYEV